MNLFFISCRSHLTACCVKGRLRILSWLCKYSVISSEFRVGIILMLVDRNNDILPQWPLHVFKLHFVPIQMTPGLADRDSEWIPLTRKCPGCQTHSVDVGSLSNGVGGSM
jgi:hypothetical protein